MLRTRLIPREMWKEIRHACFKQETPEDCESTTPDVQEIHPNFYCKWEPWMAVRTKEHATQRPTTPEWLRKAPYKNYAFPRDKAGNICNARVEGIFAFLK